MRSNKAGISLVETMVALVILGIIGVAIVRVLLQVETANNSARIRNEAAQLAQEGVEQVRGYFQTSGGYAGLQNKMASCGGVYSDGTFQTCANGSCSNTVLNATGQQITYSGTRVTTDNLCQSVIVGMDGNAVKIRSVIGWKEKGVSYHTEVDANFYNY